MSTIDQVGVTDITGAAFPGYINIARDGDEVRLTIRDKDGPTAVRQFTRSEAISFFASALGVLA